MELVIESKKHGRHIVYYDECDHEIVSQYNWCLHKGDTTLYVRANAWNKETKKSFHPYMHRLILAVVKSQQIDHKDHNGLNNRRDNLRLCNGSENGYNKPPALNNSTGYKGVHYYKKRDNYQVNIVVGKKRIHGGYFKKIEDAAKKYNELALKYHGEFAYLNKIQ